MDDQLVILEPSYLTSKLKFLRRDTKKKLRNQHLRFIKQRIQKYQIQSSLTFSPEFHNIKYEDSDFQSPTPENRKVQLKVSPKLLERKRMGLEKMLKEKKMNFSQKIAFPINTFSDFDFECNLFTKNGWPNYVFFAGPTFWIYNNFMIKVTVNIKY